jgi:hypothetical protein
VTRFFGAASRKVKFGPSCLKARSLIGAKSTIAERQREVVQLQVKREGLRFDGLGQRRDGAGG